MGVCLMICELGVDDLYEEVEYGQERGAVSAPRAEEPREVSDAQQFNVISFPNGSIWLIWAA
jgi:hypothetical protein